MKHTYIHLFVLSVLVVGIFGCGTLTSTFTSIAPDFKKVPEDAVRRLAADIEKTVADGVRETDFVLPDGLVLSEEVRQAIRTRAARNDVLSQFKDTGHVWERCDGQIYIIHSREYRRGFRSRDKDRHALLVNSEAANRWTIYEGIRKDNAFPPDSLSAIQRIFFEERLSFMKPGHMYETEQGEASPIGNRL